MASKTLGVFIILIFVALSAAAAFQYLEMDAYGLPMTLKERFFPASEAVVTPVATTPAESAPVAP